MFNWIRGIHTQAKETFTRRYERGRGMHAVSDLLICPYLSTIVKSYADHDVTVVTAPTGSGKTLSVSF